MAFNAALVWEERPDGSSSNGGCFDPSITGTSTDYSQQSSPQLTVTDAACSASTTISSVTGGFTMAMVGNGVHVNSAIFIIQSVTDTNHIVVDRAAGTFSGQTLNVGGAVTIAANGHDAFFYGAAAGNTVWVRGTNSSGGAASYTSTVQLQGSSSATADQPVAVIGYSTARGDGGLAAVASANGATLTAGDMICRNMKITGNTSFNPTLLVPGNNCYVENMWLVNGSNDATAIRVNGSYCFLRNILADANQSSVNDATARDQGTGNLWRFCVFKNSRSGKPGFFHSGVGTLFQYCLFWKNGTHGFQDNNPTPNAKFLNCIFWGNGSAGAELAQVADNGLTDWTFDSCIFGSNGTYDLSYASANLASNAGAKLWVNEAWRCNFFNTTGTARYHNLPASVNDTTLSGDPFVASASGNFTLDTNAASQAVISTLCGTTFVDGLNTTNIVAGFSGVLPTSSDTASMRSLWREINNQRSTLVVPDATVDLYLDGGLQEINRQVAYYYVTDSASIALITNQQEYNLPEDVLEVVWVKWNGQRAIEKGSIEQWMRNNDDWQNEPAGVGRYWAHYANVLVLRPAPSAATVAAGSTLTFRYVSAPPSISTSGPAEADHEMQRLAVYYATWLWCAAYPDSAAAQQRAATYKAAFDEGIVRVTERYARRGISR